MQRRLVPAFALLAAALFCNGAAAQSQSSCGENVWPGSSIAYQFRQRRACAQDVISSVGGTVCGFYAGETVIGLRGLRKFTKQQREAGVSGAGFTVHRLDPDHFVRFLRFDLGLVLWVQQRRDPNRRRDCPDNVAIIDADGRIFDLEELAGAKR